MNQVTPEELFQVIGEQTVAIRKQGQEIMRLQQEASKPKPQKKEDKKE